MAQLIQMPLWGTPNTPKFTRSNLTQLPHYLEDIEFLGDAVALDTAGKIWTMICYVNLDEAKVWKPLSKAAAVAVNWAAF